METASSSSSPGPGGQRQSMSRNYFWDFGQVQLLTDTRECVQFLWTVCSRHRMWEKAVNTTMPAQIFRIVEFQWDGCRCSGLGLNIVDISSKCSGAMWVLRRLQMEACRKLPFLSSLQPPVHVRLVLGAGCDDCRVCGPIYYLPISYLCIYVRPGCKDCDWECGDKGQGDEESDSGVILHQLWVTASPAQPSPALPPPTSQCRDLTHTF